MIDDSDQHLHPIYRIDINKMVRSYLVELLRLIYMEALSKFPKDVQIQLLYAQFAIQHMHNPFICVNVLRCFNPKS